MIDLRTKSFGERLKAIRQSVLNLARVEFSKKFGISDLNMRNWETGKSNITATSLQKLLEALQKKNIVVDKDWLLYGTGYSPFLANSQKIDDVADCSDKNTIVFEVSDELYDPEFSKGDLIKGLLIDPQSLQDGSKVLVELKKSKKEIRKVVVGSEGLICFLAVGRMNFTKPLTYKPSMKVYKIIWFKSQSDQK